MIEKIVDEIIKGRRLKRGENFEFLLNSNLEELCSGADKLRTYFCGNRVDLCTIINGKSGNCTEDCKYCAQSGKHKTGIKEYSFLDVDSIVEDAKCNAKEGVHRYSIVTAGRTLSDKNMKQALLAYRRMHEECDIKLCASHGLLNFEQFVALKAAGVGRYHDNIETSKRYFKNICTTHTYEDKITSIKNAQKAGLEVCSGGIIGMGETFEDRIDMAISLSELEVNSIPINALIPIKGTPLQDLPLISAEDILRTIAIFRFINPKAEIRLAAGRSIMNHSGETAFHSGANATITGNMLTTSSYNTKQDIEMLTKLGFDLSKA